MLHLGDGAGHVDARDVGKAAHQRAVETGCRRRAKRAHVGGRHLGQIAHRVHGEEVGPHRAPVHLAQRGDDRVGLHAADVKAQRVADLQRQRLGQPLLDADGALLFLDPAPGHHGVLRRLLGARRQVELALHQTARALVGVVERRHGPAVDGHEPAPDHRVPVEALDTTLAQGRAKGIALLGHDVDDKAVRRIGRRGLAPARDQVRAQQHQQHQRQQTDRQRADLQHGKGGARRDLARGQHEPARRAALVDEPAQQRDRGPARQGKDQRGAGKTPDGDQAQRQVAAGRQQQG